MMINSAFKYNNYIHLLSRMPNTPQFFLCLLSRHLAVYVDDLIVFSPNPTSMSAAKKELLDLFKSKDLGELSYVLGIKLDQGVIRLEWLFY